MLGKTKNFLFNLCKRKTILFVFFFSFFGLTFARSASAAWTENLANWIATRPVLLIVWLLVKFAIWWTAWTGSFLNWVLSPNFISYSYTNPGGPNANPIIEVGLGVTQGFVNMILVLILVYIAIATILRLAGYETKKLLITFILVALLVNFAPVICGVIVDASNIVMNFFVQDLKADAFGKTMGTKVEQILAGFDWKTPIGEAYGRILQLVVMVGFLFVLANILFLFAIIFILRYLVIWLLVILSPLAFVCYILPMTRKYFDKWWEQFINWSFIGVTAGFFLYLGLLFVTKIQAGAAIAAPTTGEGGLFDSVLPYFISAIFLGLGAVFGIQTSAIGASTVISGIKRGNKASIKWTRRGATWMAGKAGSRIKEHAEDKLRIRERALGLTKRWEKHPTVRWLLPEKLRKYSQMRPAIDEAMKKLDYLSSRDLARMTQNKTLFGKDANAAMMIMLNRGDTQDRLNAYRDDHKAKTGTKLTDKEIFQKEDFRKEMERTVQISFESGYQSKLMRGDPRLARIAAGKKWAFGYDNLTEDDAVRKAAGEARAKNIDNWEREVVEDEIVAETLLSKGRDVPEAIVRLVKRGQETLLKTFDKNFTSWVDNTLDPGIAKGVRKGDKISTESAINKYQEFIKEKHGASGYFDYMRGQRAKEMGWREMKYDPSSKKGTPSPPTAGAATMGSPPSTGKQSNIPRTGKQGKKASNIPTTGKGGKRKYVESKVVKSKPLKKELPPSSE